MSNTGTTAHESIVMDSDQVRRDLIEIANHVERTIDIPNAMIKFGKGEATIKRYLKGEFTHLATARLMLEFFKQCVQFREQAAA